MAAVALLSDVLFIANFPLSVQPKRLRMRDDGLLALVDNNAVYVF